VPSDEPWDRFVALLSRPPLSPKGLAKLFPARDASAEWPAALPTPRSTLP
jgi:hypothetical protein